MSRRRENPASYLVMLCVAGFALLVPHTALGQVATSAPIKTVERDNCGAALAARIRELEQLIERGQVAPEDKLKDIFRDFVAWRQRFAAEFFEAYSVRFVRGCVKTVQDTTNLGPGGAALLAGMLLAADEAPLSTVVRPGMDPIQAIVKYGWSQRWRGQAVTKTVPGTRFPTLRGAFGALLETMPLWIIAGVMDQGVANFRNIAQWTKIDDNTAFHTWILDCAEYGKQGAVNQNVRDFVRDEGKLLAQITGDPVFKAFAQGGAQDGQIAQVLARHCEALLVFFGQFEEAYGDNSFPRYKINEQGRFGFGRHDAGYYRRILIDRYRRDLAGLRLELIRLSPKACDAACPEEDGTPPAEGDAGLPPELDWTPPAPMPADLPADPPAMPDPAPNAGTVPPPPADSKQAALSPDGAQGVAPQDALPVAPGPAAPDGAAIPPDPSSFVPPKVQLPQISMPADSPVARLLANPCGVDAAEACSVLLPEFRTACTREVAGILDICRRGPSITACAARCEGNWQQGVHDQALRDIAKAHIRKVAGQTGDADAEQAKVLQAERARNEERIAAIREQAASRKITLYQNTLNGEILRHAGPPFEPEPPLIMVGEEPGRLRFSERGEMRAREIRNRYIDQQLDDLIARASAIDAWVQTALAQWTPDPAIPDGRCTPAQNDANRAACLADCAGNAPAQPVNICHATYIPQLVLPYGRATLYPPAHSERAIAAK